MHKYITSLNCFFIQIWVHSELHETSITLSIVFKKFMVCIKVIIYHLHFFFSNQQHEIIWNYCYFWKLPTLVLTTTIDSHFCKSWKTTIWWNEKKIWPLFFSRHIDRLMIFALCLSDFFFRKKGKVICNILFFLREIIFLTFLEYVVLFEQILLLKMLNNDSINFPTFCSLSDWLHDIPLWKNVYSI